MANYFWVGGSATWNGVNTANWSASSGGAGGVGPPTSADTATFDTLSNATAYIVTIAAGATCSDVLFGPPLSGNITVAGSGAFVVAGSFAYAASGVTRTYSGAITFSSTSPGKTITCSGNLLTAGNVIFDGVGGAWQFQDSFVISTGVITLTNGSVDTNGQSVTASTILSTNSNTRSLSLGASAVSLSSSVTTIDFTISTNLTFNAGTSTITFTGASWTFNTGGQTFFNIITTNTLQVYNIIIGAATFNNFSIASGNSNYKKVFFNDNITINGTFTFSGTSAAVRGTLLAGNSTSVGTSVTITANAYSPSFVDFEGITIAGTASPVSGTSLGDCGGNSGITFTAPKTVYWNLAGSNSWTAAGWATTSGGSPSAANYPIPQDTATFDNSSAITTVTVIQLYNLANIDASARTNAMTFGVTANAIAYGNMNFGSGVVFSGTASFEIRAYSARTLTSNSNNYTFPLVVTMVGTTLTLGSNLPSGNTLSLNYGTLSANGNNVTCTKFISTSDNTRVLNMGSGNWTVSSTGTVWSVQNSGTLTVNASTSTITLNNTTTTARSFQGSGKTYNNLVIGGTTGISTLTFLDGNTFNTISSTKTVANTIKFTAGTTTTVANWTVSGTMGNVVTLGSVTSAQHTLVKTGGGTISASFMNISYSNATPATTWYAPNSTDSGNNTGWIFGPAPPPSNGGFFLLF